VPLRNRCKKGALAPCSWAPEESQIESCEHQDNANVRYQPFPESVSEEREIYTDYDGNHCHHEKRASDLSTRYRLHSLYRNGRNEFPGNRLSPGEFCDQSMAQVDPSATVRRLQSRHSERRERTSAEAPGSLTLRVGHASRPPPTIVGGYISRVEGELALAAMELPLTPGSCISA
jgi:hypothetical protein